MAQSNIQTVDDPEDEERVAKLYDEIESFRARARKVKPNELNLSSLNEMIVGTVLPIMKEMAHYLREHTEHIYGLYDQIEGGEDETKISLEHARKFELVTQYAIFLAKAQIENGAATMEAAEKAKHMEVLATAEECLKILEDHTFEEEESEEEGAAQE